MSATTPFSFPDPQLIQKDLLPSEGPAKCTWQASGSSTNTPHVKCPAMQKPKIMDSILDNIGNTPLVRINSITKDEGIECEILAKCEYFNAGGSVKDRIGKRMVEDAEASGRIKPGDTLIEPTSGNTGIGLALAAAIKGYPMIITLPEKMSQEKVDVLKALGAQIIRTPTEAAFDSPESHIGVAKRLNKDIPNSHILDQYANPSNPLAHYDGTAEELLAQTDGRIDYLIATAGTGGTISGIARKLKEKLPNLKVIGVDPIGSILALPNSLNGEITSYKVEGIGYDFIPNVLDRGIIDGWYKSQDKESFTMSRRLIKQEGLLVGGSAGSCMAAAVNICKQLKLDKSKRVVVLFADSVRNYMTKFLNDGWMIENGFMEAPTEENSPWWHSKKVSDLHLMPPHTITTDVSCEQCIEILNKHGFDQLPCVNEDGSIAGMVTLGNLMSQMTSGRVSHTQPIVKALYTQFKTLNMNTSLATLSRIFDKDHFAVITTTQKSISSTQTSEKVIIYGVVTRIDLLNYIVKNKPL